MLAGYGRAKAGAETNLYPEPKPLTNVVVFETRPKCAPFQKNKIILSIFCQIGKH
jgi:hypothetical protein